MSDIYTRDGYTLDVSFSDGEAPNALKFNTLESLLETAVDYLRMAVGDVTFEKQYYSDQDSNPLFISNLAYAIGSMELVGPKILPSSIDSHTITLTAGAKEHELEYPAILAVGASITGSTDSSVTSGAGGYEDPPTSDGKWCWRGRSKIVTYSEAEGNTITYAASLGSGDLSGNYLNVLPPKEQADNGTALTIGAPVANKYELGLPSYTHDIDGDSVPSFGQKQITLPSWYYSVSGVNVGDTWPAGMILLWNVTKEKIVMTSTNSDPLFERTAVNQTLYVTTDDADFATEYATDDFCLIVLGTTIGQVINHLRGEAKTHTHNGDSDSLISHDRLLGLIPDYDASLGNVFGETDHEGNDKHPDLLSRKGYDSGSSANTRGMMLGDLHMGSSTNDGTSQDPDYDHATNDSHKVTFGSHSDGPSLQQKSIDYGATGTPADWEVVLQTKLDLDGGGGSWDTALHNFSGANFLPHYIVTSRSHASSAPSNSSSVWRKDIRVFNTLAGAISAANDDSGAIIHVESNFTATLATSQEIGANTHIIGPADNTAVIKPASAIPSQLFEVTGINVTIEGLKFDADDYSIDQAIKVDSCTFTTIKQCSFTSSGTGMFNKGINLSGCSYSLLEGNAFNNQNGSGSEFGVHGSSASSIIKIRKNYFIQSTTDTWDAAIYSGPGGTEWFVYDNYIEQGNIEFNAADFVIRNNVVTGQILMNTTLTSAYAKPIVIVNNQVVDTICIQIEACAAPVIIEDNKVKLNDINGSAMIYLKGHANNIAGYQVKDNTVIGTDDGSNYAAFGIGVEEASDCSISGNKISSVYLRGIYAINSPQAHIVENSIVDFADNSYGHSAVSAIGDMASGIYLKGTATSAAYHCSHSHISDNTIYGASDCIASGIVIYSAHGDEGGSPVTSDCVIHNNTMKRVQVVTQHSAGSINTFQGGVFVYDSDRTIVSKNRVHSHGGSAFKGNGHGVVIASDTGNSEVASGVSIINNYIYLYDTQPSIPLYGIGILADCENLQIDNNRIVGISTADSGYGIYCFADTGLAAINNCMITGRKYGIDINSTTSSGVTVTNCTVEILASEDDAIGIRADHVTDCKITGGGGDDEVLIDMPGYNFEVCNNTLTTLGGAGGDGYGIFASNEDNGLTRSGLVKGNRIWVTEYGYPINVAAGAGYIYNMIIEGNLIKATGPNPPTHTAITYNGMNIVIANNLIITEDPSVLSAKLALSGAAQAGGKQIISGNILAWSAVANWGGQVSAGAVDGVQRQYDINGSLNAGDLNRYF